MPARHRSRQRALQVLYQWDMTKQPVAQAISSFYETLYSDEEKLAPGRDEFMEELVTGTSQMATAIDDRIVAKSENWKLDRMPVVDRNILRLAIYEMSRQETPAAVVIDEALELARQFSGEESVGFVNGILDAVHREEECWKAGALLIGAVDLVDEVIEGVEIDAANGDSRRVDGEKFAPELFFRGMQADDDDGVRVHGAFSSIG